MTSREWQADRRAVFERDEHTCRHCGTYARGSGSTGVRVFPVDSVPIGDTVHRSLLVTVCDDCFELLRRDSLEPVDVEDSTVLFESVREITETQGTTISIAASFASLVTTLPDRLESGTELDYVEPRGDLRLRLAVVDSLLDRLASIDRSTLDEPVDEALAKFINDATALQGSLHRLLELSETVVAALERCHVCLDRLDADATRCSTCATDGFEVGDWRGTDDSVDFEGLFSALNGTLREATTATDAVTTSATSLAERIVGGEDA